jgi:plastocyanin
MRRRLPLPLALLALLAVAPPALAADTTVDVRDFKFVDRAVQVDVGDTVTWSFVQDGHTTRSDAGLPERWNSGPDTGAVGSTFAHTFDTPGRFRYFCEPHQGFMRGTVTVGRDRFPKSQTAFRRRLRGSRISFGFRLREPARVVARLSGAAKRSATRRRLRPGRHSITFRGLESGTYRGVVTFTDDFGKVSTERVRTVVP